jgi:arylsulfatase A-like enzyme
MVLDPRSPNKPLVVREVVSLRDMAATILDLVGVRADSVGIEGRSLARYWEPGSVTAEESGSRSAETAFSVLYRGAETEPWYPIERGPAMYSLIDSDYHYILTGDGTEELFHIPSDPMEEANLSTQPGMRNLVVEFRTRLRALAPEAVGPGS